MGKRKDSEPQAKKKKEKASKKQKKEENLQSVDGPATSTQELEALEPQKGVSSSPADASNISHAKENAETPSESKKDKKKKKKSKKKTKSKDDVADEADDGSGTTSKATEPVNDDVSDVADSKEENDSEDMKPHSKEATDQENSSDDDDNELLAAAAAWADDDENEKLLSTSPSDGNKLDPKNLSLHITQLPFDCNELDLRRLFAEQGCAITSVRLVYDRDERGRKTVFRGVAFVDCLDARSYQTALEKLNRKSSIRGRKLNVRPTRSREELADIVSRTREMVQEKIRSQKAGENRDTTEASSPLSKKQQKRQKQKEKKKLAIEKMKAAKASPKPTKHKLVKPKATSKITTKEKGSKTTAKNSKDGKDEDKKLTKKERNRRAAIILGRRRGKG